MNTPSRVLELLQSTPARIGLAVAYAEGTSVFAHREAEVFAQASAIKIPILWELHRAAAAGELSLDEVLPIDPANGAGGCGVLQSFSSAETRVALSDLAVLMMVLSDNVATNLLIDRVGLDAVNALMDSQGAGATRLRRKMMDQPARDAGRENVSTPEDAVRLMLRLDAAEGEADPTGVAVLKTLRLKKQSPVTAAIYDKASRLATKPGMLDGLRTEWSLVEPTNGPRYAMALMADGAQDDVLQPLFRDLAAAVHQESTASA